MTSAPRSARSWVPKGPAPNCDTARIRSPSSGGRAISVGEPALTEGGVVLLGHEDLSRVGAHGFASLVRPQSLNGDDAAVALLRLAHLEHAGLRVECIADEGRLLMLERVDLEVGDGTAR